MSSEFYFLKDFLQRKSHKDTKVEKITKRGNANMTDIVSIYALVDLCPIRVLVGQAGGMRGGKTFSGVLRRRDTAGGS
jgi:hypothetical protein